MTLRPVVAAAVLAATMATVAGGAAGSAHGGFRILLVTSMDGAPYRGSAVEIRRGTVLRPTALARAVESANFSPDGARLVYGTGLFARRQAAYLTTLRGRGTRTLAVAHRCGAHSCPVTSQAWAPDGRRIALAAWDERPRIFVVSAASGRRREITPRNATVDDTYRDVSWSPDGRLVAFTRYRGRSNTNVCCTIDHQVMRPDGTRRRWVYRHRRGDTAYDSLGFTWSPDSRRLAVTVLSRGINWAGVVDVRSRRTRWLRVGSPGPQVAWAPDSRTLALPDSENGVILAAASEHRYRRVLAGTAVRAVAFAPDGRSLVAAVAPRPAGSVRELRVASVDGETPAVVFRTRRGWSIRHVETRR